MDRPSVAPARGAFLQCDAPGIPTPGSGSSPESQSPPKSLGQAPPAAAASPLGMAWSHVIIPNYQPALPAPALPAPQQQLRGSYGSTAAVGCPNPWPASLDGVIYRIASIDTAASVSQTSLPDSVGSCAAIHLSTPSSTAGDGQEMELLHLLIEAQLRRQEADAAMAAAVHAADNASNATALVSEFELSLRLQPANAGGLLSGLRGTINANAALAPAAAAGQLPLAQLPGGPPALEAAFFAAAGGGGSPVVFAHMSPAAFPIAAQGPAAVPPPAVLDVGAAYHSYWRPVTLPPSAHRGNGPARFVGQGF